MSRRRNELEAEFTRGLNQNGKLFHLENKSVFFLIVFVTSRQRCLQVSKSCSVLIKVIFYGSSSLQACNCDNKKHFKSIRSLRQSSIGPLIEEEKTLPQTDVAPRCYKCMDIQDGIGLDDRVGKLKSRIRDAYKWEGGWSRQDAGWTLGKKMLSPAANPIFYTKQPALPICSLFIV